MSEQKVDNRIGADVGMAQAVLRNRAEELKHEAEHLGRKHLKFVMNKNKSKTWAEKSVLYLTVRMRDNAPAVTWYEVRWYGSLALKTRRAEKKAIPKPKSRYGYNLEALLNKAQPWEASLVTDIERELTKIRREAFFIAKAIGNLNRVLKAGAE